MAHDGVMEHPSSLKPQLASPLFAKAAPLTQPSAQPASPSASQPSSPSHSSSNDDGTLQFCAVPTLPTGPTLRPIVSANMALAPAAAFSTAPCICHRFVEMDAALITRHVQGSQVALRTITDAINAYTLLQWQGSAAQTCQSKLDSMRQLIAGIDDELTVTLRMTTIRGQGR